MPAKHLIALLLALGGVLIALPASARKVQSGAFDICRIIDGGTVTHTADGKTTCCAIEPYGPNKGKKYCVRCNEDLSDCHEYVAQQRPVAPSGTKKR